jgi:hypothetical protein
MFLTAVAEKSHFNLDLQSLLRAAKRQSSFGDIHVELYKIHVNI